MTHKSETEIAQIKQLHRSNTCSFGVYLRLCSAEVMFRDVIFFQD